MTTIHNILNPVHFKYAGHILQRCADHVIFESHYERNRLLQSGLSESRCEVVHSGIDTDIFAPQPVSQPLLEKLQLDKSKHVIFGIVARLSEEKGHQYLLPAFRQLLQREPNVRLVIVGDGPLESPIRQQRAELGLEDTVIMTGAQRNIPDYLSIFDVFVLSSTRESFPLAAREAMAAGQARHRNLALAAVLKLWKTGTQVTCLKQATWMTWLKKWTIYSVTASSKPLGAMPASAW